MKRIGARGAILAGMVASAAILPAIPAAAQIVNVPGVGNVDVPQNVIDMLQTPQGQQVVSQAPPQLRQAIEQAAPQASPVGMRALRAAQAEVGTPYVWGGQRPGGFDCSGLVKWSYAQAGVMVPRTSEEQAHAGHAVPVQDIQPGDVVIYDGGGHAGIYAGNGQILQAPHTGDHVKYSPLHSMPIYAVRRI